MIMLPRASFVLVACAALTHDRPCATPCRRPPAAQPGPPAAGPALRILSPGEDAYVSGPTLLRARVEPPEAVAAPHVLRQRPPGVRADASCRSSANGTPAPTIAEHQVRAVATLKDGGRLVQTVRTKSVGYTERVDVDVVQVTVTVIDDRGRFVARHAAVGVPRRSKTGRPQTITHFASEDVPLELVVADRHQRQHGAGDAEAEDGGEGIPRRRAGAAIR